MAKVTQGLSHNLLAFSSSPSNFLFGIPAIQKLNLPSCRLGWHNNDSNPADPKSAYISGRQSDYCRLEALGSLYRDRRQLPTWCLFITINNTNKLLGADSPNQDNTSMNDRYLRANLSTSFQIIKDYGSIEGLPTSIQWSLCTVTMKHMPQSNSRRAKAFPRHSTNNVCHI
jgi:hypothetical protein